MIYLVTRQIALFDSLLFNIVSLDEGIELLLNYEELGLDTETSGLDCFTKKLLLLQIGNKDIQVLFDIDSYNGKIPDKLKNFLNTNKVLYILQNVKFDWKFLFHQGVLLKRVYDTMLAEIILTNGLQYDGRDLATIVRKYCGVYLDKSIRGEIIRNGLTDAVLQYGAKDVQYLLEVKEKQLIKAKELDVLGAIQLDNSFVIPLAYTEYCGIKLNFPRWVEKTHKSMEEVLRLKALLEKQLLDDGKINYFSGMQDMFSGEQECIINWDSPKQVIKLFKEYGINTILKDKGKDKETIDAKVLEPQKKKFTILPPYLEYKGKQKEVTTYGMSWKKYISSVTGRIHTTYQQLMDTGRLSCGNKRDGTPNLQNLPSDSETRGCFIPEEGNVMVDADYSSQEQVVLANFSKEKNLIDFYAKGFSDMHSYVAFLMYENIRRCSIEELTPDKLSYIKKDYADKRYLAKIAGFSINYGGNGSTISKNCNIPAKDGEFVYNSYFKAFPEMKNYFDLVFQKAAHFGYIQFNNVTKRKFFFDLEENDFFLLRESVESPYFWQLHDNPREAIKKYNKAKSDIARMAQNFPIQGSSADITKYACIIFFRELIQRDWLNIVKIVNLVHDEILVECPIEIVEEVKQVLLNSMEEAGKPFCKIVSLKADALHGSFWIH